MELGRALVGFAFVLFEVDPLAVGLALSSTPSRLVMVGWRAGDPVFVVFEVSGRLRLLVISSTAAAKVVWGMVLKSMTCENLGGHESRSVGSPLCLPSGSRSFRGVGGGRSRSLEDEEEAMGSIGGFWCCSPRSVGGS